MTLSKEGEDHAALPLAGRSGRASPEPPEGREAAGRFQDPGQGRAAAARGRGGAPLCSAPRGPPAAAAPPAAFLGGVSRVGCGRVCSLRVGCKRSTSSPCSSGTVAAPGPPGALARYEKSPPLRT